MALAIGQIVDGEVTNILKFGAFVNLPEGKSGLVHISEVSDSYVEDINEFLKRGQKIKVKILSIDEKGKIDLSMKQAQKKSTKPVEFETSKQNDEMSFEDKLSKFLKDSNEKFEQARSRENFKMAGQRRNK
ncbi:S1 RNA-binding domain-containing protein [Anaerosphaera multitolerans]|uniref:S1 RNA-binding domain-containing protein n=1 Tax=Anaerosphaera multitolerans TaxID=2487351 RepID=A0A437S6D3_9FIRM|nr:S1 RNA-binding domain-containing protein [Anaerosphaera multitolerans]RVU54566.1 S1 RNA-binding domain-containing protein [Anaerosphaera multitolerans]